MRKFSRASLAFATMLSLAGIVALPARAADDAKPAGKGTVSGTVMDKDGKGVEGVEVRLMKPFGRRGGGAGGPPPETKKESSQNPAARGLADDEKPASPPPGGQGGRRMPKPVATATSDKDGKFEMKDVPAGDYMVGVRDDDKKVYGRTNVTVKDGETATVEIKTTDTPPTRGPGGGGQGGGGRKGPPPQDK